MYADRVHGFVYELVDPSLAWEEADLEFVQRYLPQSQLQCLIRPEKIAKMVVNLASPLASATNSWALCMNGRYTDAVLP